MGLSIGIVGDRDLERVSHRATEAALTHAGAGFQWLGTDGEHDYASQAALFVAPGSPYRSRDGALAAIRCAREAGIPLLATCGGFQHLLIEFARDVLGHRAAEHAETAPDAPDLVVTPLACSLVGTRGTVALSAGSTVQRAHDAVEAEEEYRCRFGLAPSWEGPMEAAGLRIVGRDGAGRARAAELQGHPFFVGTLYVPQLSSEPGRPHPLVVALVEAARARARADRARRP